MPLKINIFVWRLFLNRILTKANLLWRHILATFDVNCLSDCGCFKDRDNLFTKFDLYSKHCSLIYGWLGILTTLNGNLQDRLLQFGGLGVFLGKILG